MRPHLRLPRAVRGVVRVVVRVVTAVTTSVVAVAAVVAAVAVFALVVAGGLVLTARPAAADPPRPTDYRSIVTGVSPTTDAVDVTIVGGDAFIELTVAPGHEVVVTGYDNEPYLRFGADGTVEENRSSPAAYVNARRFGDVAVPEGVDPQDEPDWQRVAGGGTYAWHDHRIHWMSPQPPPGVPRGDDVQQWSVLLVVDGNAVTVNGVLRYEPAASWWPWALAAVAVAAVVWLAGRVWSRRDVLRVAGAVGGLVAVVVAAGEQLSIPDGAGRSLVRFAVPVVGLVAGAVALVAGRLGHRPQADIAGIAAVAAVTGWAVRRLAVLSKPVLPTLLHPDLDRAGTAIALGLAGGAVALVLAGLDRPHPTPAGPDGPAPPDDTDTDTDTDAPVPDGA